MQRQLFCGVQVEYYGIKENWNLKQVLQGIRRIPNGIWGNGANVMPACLVPHIFHFHFAFVCFKVSDQKGQSFRVHVEPDYYRQQLHGEERTENIFLSCRRHGVETKQQMEL